MASQGCASAGSYKKQRADMQYLQCGCKSFKDGCYSGTLKKFPPSCLFQGSQRAAGSFLYMLVVVPHSREQTLHAAQEYKSLPYHCHTQIKCCRTCQIGTFSGKCKGLCLNSRIGTFIHKRTGSGKIYWQTHATVNEPLPASIKAWALGLRERMRASAPQQLYQTAASPGC